MAVDGSTAHLFSDAKGKMEAHFGLHRGKVMGRLMSYYDVLNELNILGGISPIKTSENAIARKWRGELAKDMPYIKRPVFLYDAKFPGGAFIYEHLQDGQDFVMRCSLTFNIYVVRFLESGEKDSIVEFHLTAPAIKELRQLGYQVDKDTRFRVRLIRIELDNGETEVLMTSLLDQKRYLHSDFGTLYFKRWGGETNYDALKNKMQIEVVSGHCVEAVLQDFHAALMLLNLQSLVEAACQPTIEPMNEQRKHDYAVNQNVAIGCMKHRVVALFLSPYPEMVLAELEAIFCRHLEPIRPNRKLPRNKKIKHLKGKYKTLTNYRRAI